MSGDQAVGSSPLHSINCGRNDIHPIPKVSNIMNMYIYAISTLGSPAKPRIYSVRPVPRRITAVLVFHLHRTRILHPIALHGSNTLFALVWTLEI